MSINSILATSVTGLTAARQGINVSSHNIANANVEGYSRQRAYYTTNSPQYIGNAGYIGLGVSTSQILRIRDSFLDGQIQDASTSIEFDMAQQEVMETIELFLDEPSDFGLNAKMAEMFDSWDTLANNPENQAKQTLLIESSKVFVEHINGLASRLDELKGSVTSTIDGNHTKVSELVTYLDDINYNLTLTNPNDGPPNDLLDQRDKTVEELSKYFELDVTYNTDYTADVNVVTTGGNFEITAPTNSDPTVPGVDTTTLAGTFTGGRIKGYEDSLDEIDLVIADLNTLAEDVATEINTLHNSNDGTGPGGAFFTFTSGNAAFDIAVETDIVDRSRRINVGAVATVGDGTNAAAIADLQESGIISGTSTPRDFYTDTVVTLGSKLSTTKKGIETKDLLLTQLQNKRESVSGVSIDEETTSLMQFQSAYDANARVIQVAQEMLDTLLSLVR
jgi:flagellar hook-associated protein 1 FlgK